MFHRMIQRRRDAWYRTESCRARDVVDYILARGMMRDAQVEAIKTYLYLKLACGGRPLADLFCEGVFNSETFAFDEMLIAATARECLKTSPAARALLEYARLANADGQQVSKQLEQALCKAADKIDCAAFFRRAFYDVSYADYLFSLPMGAGKTFLMAAFIYLDLYYARIDPQNPAFAHNFIILAPSGLKASVVPSLRTIQDFDPSWVLPEPTASALRRQMAFEVLDEAKAAGRSNRTKNPNVQKLARHQPISDVFGLVAVTNAEKVILDRVRVADGQPLLIEETADDRDWQENELRNMIGRIPALSVFIDEVHHAVSAEIKLRAVVNKWAAGGTVNAVVGFSGTPYLEKAERQTVTETLSVATKAIANIVSFYPLIDGVGNFLKKPVVKISEADDALRIIESGVCAFLDAYGSTVYPDGCAAKLAVYCGTIEKLEEKVYPLVARLAAARGLGPEAILRFHKGNRRHPQPPDSAYQFEMLDAPESRVRIALLVQIGKEGWDCRSLTGVVLSQEGDCPVNMVLQTSCRCLRQTTRGAYETALIYLNRSNAQVLNGQLQQQQRISLDEFSSADARPVLRRYDRTAHLKLPKVAFYQLKVSADTLVVEPADPGRDLPRAAADARLRGDRILTTDLTMATGRTTTQMVEKERGDEPATFNGWLRGIVKGGFGTPSLAALRAQADALRALYETITFEREGTRFYSSRWDRAAVEGKIRTAFHARRDFKTKEELIPEKASLLNVANFTPTVRTDNPKAYYPDQKVTERIIADDGGASETAKIIRFLEASGQTDMARLMRAQNGAHVNQDRSFHYVPYRTDSAFEQRFLKEVLSFEEIDRLGLEVYYNGDRALTEFRIKCYRRAEHGAWRFVGLYTPDFLIVQRREGAIHKVVVVETKGTLYAHEPTFRAKRTFMETTFARLNNEAFGYARFDYLYVEDGDDERARFDATRDRIRAFFNEVSSHAD